ncbi:MAG: thiolase family protein [Polyangiaceae bacterium]|nr:thiolase family protein [Polyangiaceae bacterium]
MAHVVGVGMLRFGKLPDRGIKALAAEVLERTLADAGLGRGDVEAVWFSNSGWGMNGGQDCIRGQVALRGAGISGVPIVNVENACAGGATALHGAVLGVTSGAYEVALAIGVEKLFQPSRLRTFASFLGGMDVEALPELMAKAEELRRAAPPPPRELPEARSPRREAGRRAARPGLGEVPRQLLDALAIADHFRLDVAGLVGDALRARLAGKGKGGGGDHSPFMDVYAVGARRHMARYGTTQRQLAVIAAKNHGHGALNPLAQIRRPMTPEEVLVDREVAAPLTRSMCAPIGDGAAAALVCSERYARRHGLGRAVRVRASVVASGARDGGGDLIEAIAVRASRRAYELAGLGPAEIHLAEVHDATAFGELHQSEALGFAPEGGGGALAESGATAIGGRLPLNPSGGLECRGHPIGASGLAQIHELVQQLRGEAGARQVAGARLALAQNGGGFLGEEEAAMAVHVLEGSVS